MDMKYNKPVQYTEKYKRPVVRFIRKGGRVIPIVDRHKSGQRVKEVGKNAAKTGLAIGIAGKIASKNEKHINAFSKFYSQKKLVKKMSHVPATVPNGRVAKAAHIGKKSARASFKIAKKVMKNYKAFSGGLLGFGALAVIGGLNLQLNSNKGISFNEDK